MSAVVGRLVAALLALLFAAAASAQEGASGLTLREVLDSSRQHFPRILEALAAQRGAEGRLREAAGAFDLVFEAEGFGYATGFYDGSAAAEGLARQPLRPLGAELYAGYSLSEGDLPVYEDQYFTNSGGALKVGALFSILRDRDIDRRRFAETDAKLGLREATLETLLTKIGVQQRALQAYWRWVAVGRQLKVYENLLLLAIERQDGLERQVRQGALAEFYLTENRQNITRRQSLVTAALRDLAKAANTLSQFYRDASGRPVVPPLGRLPAEGTLGMAADLSVSQAGVISDALQRRPELMLLRTAIEREQRRIELAENELKPQLDFGIEVKTPFGGVAEGGVSRDETDTIVGLEFSVPLQQRAAKGRLGQAQAELDQRQYEQQRIEEQVELEVRNILLELDFANELLQLAEQEVDQSERLREIESRRFQSGASDFFLVNLREETAADARVRFYDALLIARLARADYDAAVVDLERLGIVEPIDY